MALLRDVILYLCQHYPHKNELSKARLTKMVYLADWRSAILYGRQITDINWRFNYYGPYVDDVVNVARVDPDFNIIQDTNQFGDWKELIRVTNDAQRPILKKSEQAVLDHVIEVTAPKYWNDFIQLVYSTYPIVTQPRFAKLDLVALAQEYKADQPLVIDGK